VNKGSEVFKKTGQNYNKRRHYLKKMHNIDTFWGNKSIFGEEPMISVKSKDTGETRKFYDYDQT